MQEKKYKLALVIGSGGIRSIVGIGVFQALSNAGLKPDLIVGCSAGAIFGAALAQVDDAEEALKKSQSLWTSELTKVTRWSALPSILLSKFGWFKDDFSFMDDRKIIQQLHKAFREMNIEDLPIPMRITATRAATGQSVVLEKGRLVDALRASIAIPFVFTPFKMQDQLLLDGVVSDPLPLSAARDADLVIAVGMKTPVPRRATSPVKLYNRVFASITNNLMQAQLELAIASGMRVINIAPFTTRRIKLFETEAMSYLVEEGRRATLEMLPVIQKLVQQPKALNLNQQTEPLAVNL